MKKKSDPGAGEGYRTKSPVLLIAFDRPDRLAELLGALEKVKPARLYVAIDAALPGDAEQLKRVEEVKQLVSSARFPGQLEVKTADRNLGLYQATVEAVDWFFARETRGIILEDDCIPTTEFFKFMDWGLNHFSDEPRIMQINGYRPLATGRGKFTHEFTIFPFSWGWGSWARAWSQFSGEDPFSSSRTSYLLDKIERAAPGLLTRWTHLHRKHKELNPTWDYAWALACWQNSGLSVLPPKALVVNRGFDRMATHTKKQPLQLRPQHRQNKKVMQLSQVLHKPSIEDHPSRIDWRIYLFIHGLQGHTIRGIVRSLGFIPGVGWLIGTVLKISRTTANKKD